MTELRSDQLEHLADLVADRVVARLQTVPKSNRPVTAAELAEILGVTRDWVYEHADELGAERLGAGPRPRLQFDPARAADLLSTARSRRPITPPAHRPRRQRQGADRTAGGAPLLPVVDRSAACETFARTVSRANTARATWHWAPPRESQRATPARPPPTSARCATRWRAPARPRRRRPAGQGWPHTPIA